ncbi:ribosomal protection-like ABC-F family protein [Neobacillus niacini]|uniref:ribosomal protection-like ABC-F family protein n=1 Tax=Neobacillus niacini TaxID=86668 RepID=UPI0028580FE2|nr:ABC-F type ribosomal protection protein [Neobacillus niacini]MDR7001700.1 macrolide transport system ATP-binding/permease protein [Neobacillus niacini]
MFNESMTVLKATGIEKSFELRKIFDQINFEVKKGERIGLVGYNGTGKTTLANLILGRLKPDNGTIEIAKECKIGVLSQSIDYEFTNFGDTQLVDHLYEHTSGLGLEKVFDWEEDRLQHLSGGEKLKLALSLIWSSKPDFLILDEPTNHLDLKGIKWLVAELKKFQGPVLIISHDRYFLDETVNRIFEIEDKKLHFYKGNYHEYRKEKQKRNEDQFHKYTVQQKKKEKIEEQMDQLKSWSDQAHRNSTKQGRDFGMKEYHRVKAKKRDSQVKSKMKRLQNELAKNKIEKPMEELEIKFQFEADGKRGKRIIEAKNLGKRYGNRTLFQDTNFYINYGERIGLFGENGCGKTTLIRMVLDQESSSQGTLWKSDSIKIAYLSQDVHDLPEEKTAIEALGFTERQDLYRARTLLANLGLKEELITKPIATLSLGERTRVKLVDMLMKNYDVLVLDEPTNHLDLPSREQLENTLNEFTGTIITVSHDHYFLNKICDKLLVFENQKIKRIEMKPEEYMKKENANENVSKKEALMVVENRLATVLGELSLLDQNHPDFVVLDHEFKELLAQKKKLNK